MKKLNRQVLSARTSRKSLYVSACFLVVGTLLLGTSTSIPLLSLWFHKANFLNHELMTQANMQDDLLISARAQEVASIGRVITHNSSAAEARLFDRRNPVRKNRVLFNNWNDDQLVNNSLVDADFSEGSMVKETSDEGLRKSSQQAKCTKSKALLKVFMYDLPPELHFGMMDPLCVAEGNTWPSNLTSISYPGGLTEQHSTEYWLTLDLLNNPELEEEDTRTTARPCDGTAATAIRVDDARDADIYFVPFFASLSYNKFTRWGMKQKDKELQEKVVDFIVKQEAWKRSRGRDHVIVMHHPNSLLMARSLLNRATFIVADFGRFSSKVAHFGKDVVAPYKHIIPAFLEDHSSFHSRPTLLFFQGAIQRKEGGVIRKRLHSLIKNERGVIFKEGVSGEKGIRSATKGMRSSKFCLHLAGDTPSSNRLFDAIASHCVPVIISDRIELPYENVLDYSKFCVFVSAVHALRKGFLIGLLRSIEQDEWTRMWKQLFKVQEHFEYQFPSRPNDAVQMIWKSIAYKLPTIKQALHKSTRYSSSSTYKNLSS